MKKITIFYTVLGAAKMMSWKGFSTQDAKEWFERVHTPDAIFCGAVETEALMEALHLKQ